MSDTEPIQLHERARRSAVAPSAGTTPVHANANAAAVVLFTRRELDQILSLYGRKVADGEWRDYAIDFGAEKAVFSVFRRTSEYPLYRVEKCPRLARRQGAYSVVAPTGLILKRGHDLARVLEVIERRLSLVDR